MANDAPTFTSATQGWTAHMRVSGDPAAEDVQGEGRALLWLARMEQKARLGEDVVRPRRSRSPTSRKNGSRIRQAERCLRTYDRLRDGHPQPPDPGFRPAVLDAITRKQIDAFIGDWATGGPDFQERVRLDP